MLEELRIKYNKILNLIDTKYKRYFFDIVDFDNKIIGIIGARGIGKTTFLIQYLKNFDFDETLYFSADSILTSGVSLYEIAEEFSKYGGKILAIDEIHKYKNFEAELKEIYDFLDIKVLFSGSSAISLEHSRGDLSRRAILYKVKGLSFREFLELKLNTQLKKYSLQEILDNHTSIAREITGKIKVFKYFKEYLEYGYYPYYFATPKSYKLLVENSINTAIENDLLYIFHIDIDNIEKLKQLVKYLCLSKPYELNISNLSKRIGISRDTLYKYIHYLTLADVLNRIDVLNKKDTSFLKPSKLYLQNPNLYYTFCLNNEIGTIREIFFINQLEINHQVNYSKIGDFLVNERYIFEIGGKNKNKYQIKNIANSYLAIDDIEIGFQNKIPLYLFGFLY
jgi:predicted AAA+ superfamily ATPase